ncbi:MAG: trypsin-like serine protease [bacterium]|nr:trypsin-like serine protease [bacterium]
MWHALSLLPLLAPTQAPDHEDVYDSLAQESRVTPVVRVVQAASPSVVFIETEYTQRVRTWVGTRSRLANGSGSGVVIHPDGYIVTNYHVVRDARSITASFDGVPWPYKAELVSFKRSEDLALLKINEEDRPPLPSPAPIGNRLGRVEEPDLEVEAGFQSVRLGTSADLMHGERVIAIGNPHGHTHTVSTGIISGLHRDVEIREHDLHFEGLIQTDASINFGNSGGPLLNIRGELIGINSAMNTQAENIGFAIPVDRVMEVLNDILYPQARKSWLGFELLPGSDLEVGHVWLDSPAAGAGICRGDRILAVGETRVIGEEAFMHASLEIQPHQTIDLLLDRSGTEEKVSLRTWDKLDGMLFERLGATVSERSSRQGTYVVVDQISAEGVGQQLGLERGDWIPAIRPRGFPSPVKIRDKRTLNDVLSRLAGGSVVDIDVYRDTDGDRIYSRNELYKGMFRIPAGEE